jgi:type I restriction enzyme S subunit
MTQFKKYKLGDLYSVSSGLSKPREEFGFGHPFLTFKDVFYNFFLPDKLTELANTTEKEIKSCSVKKGDIFLTRTSETLNELGMSSVALKDYVNATFNGFTKRLRLKDEVDREIDPVFIGYYFRTNEIRNQIGMHASMTTRASLNSTAINSIEISIPDIRYQIPIGIILKRLDDKIELNRRTNQTLEQIAQTLFKKYFVDDIDPENLPDGWSLGKIGNISLVQNGFAFKSNDFKAEGEIGIIKIRNINNNVIDIHSTQFVLANTIISLDKKFKINSSDILIAMTGAEVGKIGIVPFNTKSLWLNQRVGKFQEKVQHGNMFTYILLTSEAYQEELQTTAMGSAQPNISGTDIENIKCTVPAEKHIIEFGATVKPLFEKICRNHEENFKLSQIRDSLLPKLMSGEIEVSTIEKEFAEA